MFKCISKVFYGIFGCSSVFLRCSREFSGVRVFLRCFREFSGVQVYF